VSGGGCKPSPRITSERLVMGSLMRFDLDEAVVDWGEALRSQSDEYVSDATEVSFLNVMPYMDAWYYINEWFGKGFDICIHTDRDPKFREVTERWLREWDIPYSDLIFRKDV